MNYTDYFILPSINTKYDSAHLSIDVFYIGTFIGLIGSCLTLIVIKYFKYKKFICDKLNIISSDEALAC